jgi:ankyrin repeat protein
MKTTSEKYAPEHYFAGTELPIACAIYTDDKSELKRLLKQNTVDINKPGKEGGYTFLYYAIELRNYSLTEILLENGADPNVLSPITYIPGAGKQSEPDYDSCIRLVCYDQYHIKYLKLLVKYGANINENRTASPLSKSISFDQKDKIEFLLKNGADVNLVAKKGLTPLLEAASFPDFELIERLLDLGADPFLEDKGHSLKKSIEYYINRTKGKPEWRKETRRLVRRLETLGITIDFSKAKFQMTE